MDATVGSKRNQNREREREREALGKIVIMFPQPECSSISVAMSQNETSRPEIHEHDGWSLPAVCPHGGTVEGDHAETGTAGESPYPLTPLVTRGHVFRLMTMRKDHSSLPLFSHL